MIWECDYGYSCFLWVVGARVLNRRVDMLSAMRSMRSSVRVVPFWYTASLKLSAGTKRRGGLDFGGDFRCLAEAQRGDKKEGRLGFWWGFWMLR